MSERNAAVATLIAADAFLALDQIQDDSIKLIVTSPPYNIGKPYERGSKLTLDEYLDWLEPIICKLCKKLSLDGSICWQAGNFVRDGEVFPLDYYFYGLFSKLGFKLRNRIIWQFNFGLHATKRFSGRYETLLWFTKSDSYTFNLDSIRVPQLYPGKCHSSRKAGKAGKPSGNPLGKNPSDYWTFSASELFENEAVWSIPNVKANHPEFTSHPCQFPHELAERCILAFSNPGDTVLDPFTGAGTTIIAAVKANRRAIGIDKDDSYIALTKSRLEALYDGTLALRKSGTSLHRPSGREKVARKPADWVEAAE